MRRIHIISVLLLFVSLNLFAQKATYEAAIAKIKSLISEHYIIKEKVKILTDSLGGMKYKDLKPQEFVEKINLQLQRYSGDKHLRLEYNPEYSRKAKVGDDSSADQRAKELKTNFGFNKIEILEDNTGLLTLKYFADPEGLEDLIKSTFNVLSNTDRMIIDLRGNSGGSGGMLQKLMSIFLDDRSTPVLQVKYKSNTIQLKTDSIPLAAYDKPLYLLCDKQTFSAGEGFAMILQNRKRAIVVGETTAGAGNISGPYVVNDSFVITIPVGVINDVLTGKGWEGTGVVPDVAVKPADALNKALEVIQKNR